MYNEINLQFKSIQVKSPVIITEKFLENFQWLQVFTYNLD